MYSVGDFSILDFVEIDILDDQGFQFKSTGIITELNKQNSCPIVVMVDKPIVNRHGIESYRIPCSVNEVKHASR